MNSKIYLNIFYEKCLKLADLSVSYYQIVTKIELSITLSKHKYVKCNLISLLIFGDSVPTVEDLHGHKIVFLTVFKKLSIFKTVVFTEMLINLKYFDCIKSEIQK